MPSWHGPWALAEAEPSDYPCCGKEACHQHRQQAGFNRSARNLWLSSMARSGYRGDIDDH